MTNRIVPRATLRDLAPPPVRQPNPLRPARVPAIEEWRDEPTAPGNGESSPLVRVMRAEASLHSSESIGLATIAEAYAAADANAKILMVEIAKRFGGGAS